MCHIFQVSSRFNTQGLVAPPSRKHIVLEDSPLCTTAVPLIIDNTRRKDFTLTKHMFILTKHYPA